MSLETPSRKEFQPTTTLLVVSKDKLFKYCSFTWDANNHTITVHENAPEYKNFDVRLPKSVNGYEIIDRRENNK